MATNKLDKLLATIWPLEVIEAKADASESPKAEPEPARAIEAGSTSEKVWTGLVQESVVEGEGLRAF